MYFIFGIDIPDICILYSLFEEGADMKINR